MSTEEIVKKVAERAELSKDNLRQFLNSAFEEVIRTYNLCENYQRRATKFGEAFEWCFRIIMQKFFPDIELTPDYKLPKACMVEGGEADFVIISRSQKKKLVAVFEAKGAADYIICDGKREELERPGMLRIDTVKKAISNAYQISRAYPDVLFFIVTSHKPKEGNAKCMCDLAEGDIVHKIVDVTNKDELDQMVRIIRAKLQQNRKIV